MKLVVAFLTSAAVLSLLLDEVRDLAGWLAPRIVRWAARSLPGDQPAVREEEWLADLEEQTSELKLLRLAYSFRFCVAAARISASRRILRWQSDYPRAEGWVKPGQGRARSGIVASYGGCEYHFPWATPVGWKGHPFIGDPLEDGPIPKKVSRIVAEWYEMDFDYAGRFPEWPPKGRGRMWLWRRRTGRTLLLFCLLPLTLPMMAIDGVRKTRRRFRIRRRRR